jgi:uncharacterized delta-60 repeat protein
MIKNLLAFSALLMAVFPAASQTPGSLDQTFGGTGQVIVSPVSVESFDNCQAVGVQSTGKTVFCGASGNWSNFEATVGRLNVDGTLDASFANNGVFIYNNALGGDFMYDLKVLNDDKILICGATSLSAANTQWAVWRLLPDGALDPTFGAGGLVQWEIEGGEDYAREIIVQNDGYLVVGGSMPAGFSNERIVVAKYLGIGSILQATPMLKGLKNKYPNSQLIFVSLKSNKSLLSHYEFIDEVLYVDDSSIIKITVTSFRLILELISRKIDLFLDLEVYSTYGSLMCLFSCSKNRLGFVLQDRDYKGFIYTHLLYLNTSLPIRHCYSQLGQLAGMEPSYAEQEPICPSLNETDLERMYKQVKTIFNFNHIYLYFHAPLK